MLSLFFSFRHYPTPSFDLPCPLFGLTLPFFLVLPCVLVVLPAPIQNIPSLSSCYPPRYIWFILHTCRRYPPSFVCYPPYFLPHFSHYFLFRQPRISCSFLLFVQRYILFTLSLHSPFFFHSSFLYFSCPISCYGKSVCYTFLFVASSLGNFRVSSLVSFLPYLSLCSHVLLCINVTRTSLLLHFVTSTNDAPLPIKLHHTSTSSIYVSLCYPDLFLHPSTGLITPPSISPSLCLPHFSFSLSFHHFSRNKQTFLLPAHYTPPSQLASSCLLLPPAPISSQPCL